MVIAQRRPAWCLLLPVLMLILVACGPDFGSGRGAEEVEITVFGASSLTDAFTDLAGPFEASHPGSRVLLHFAGSSQLAAQLQEGVRADVFASADTIQMERVVGAGRIEARAVVPFASNRLAIIVPAGNPARIASLEDLGRPGVSLVLAGSGVPIRRYTDQIVAGKAAGFREAFYGNVVSEEDNVRRVAAKIALGEADAGIVYTSDVMPDLAGVVRQIAIPGDQNVIAAYQIAPLADAHYPELAALFIDFVLSPQGQEILAGRGLGAAPGG